jgi:NADP-dependent alcohol dehydrogenase
VTIRHWKIAGEIPSGARILMPYGGESIKKNRVYDQVKAALVGREVSRRGRAVGTRRAAAHREQEPDPLGADALHPRIYFVPTAVISREATQEKLFFTNDAVSPQFSVLDPEATFSLPPRQIANGVVDAFVHVAEQYLTYPAAAPLQDRLAEAILLTLIEDGPKTLADPADYDARASLMWCATMALNGLIGLGVPRIGRRT